ncbi:MAG: ABC transporter substrate-binding protein, partial [Oribacterium sp.]|nr:ABC transporter substrate-binding protein [Oribacterium sp.]
MKRRLMSAILAVSMTASLAACASSGTPEGTTAGETATTAAGGSSDVVEIKIWSPTDEVGVENWWTEKMAQWNSEHPEIQVSREA